MCSGEQSAEPTENAQMIGLARPAMLNRLSRLVCHEFNNLLATVLGYGEMALSSSEVDEKNEALRIVVEGAERGREIIAALSTVSGREKSGKHPEDITEVVRLSCLLLKKLTERLGVTMTTSWGELQPVVLDFSGMSAALINMFWTILSYIPQGGTIRIQGRCSEGEMTLEITDNAPPLRDELLRKLLENWTVEDRPKPGRPGQTESAVGLRYARAEIEDHGGRLEVQCGDGGNSYRAAFPVEGV